MERKLLKEEGGLVCCLEQKSEIAPLVRTKLWGGEKIRHNLFEAMICDAVFSGKYGNR